MSPHSSLTNLVNRDDLNNGSTSCSNNAWGCLNKTGQFGVIFSIIIVVLAIIWIYWYTVIRPRKARDKRVDQDIEMDLGDEHTFIISSGPYQRTFVLRRGGERAPSRAVRPPSPPPPAYRPPTPGRAPLAPSGLEPSQSPEPFLRVSRTQIWQPQSGAAPQAPPRDPPQPDQSPHNPHTPQPPPFQPGIPFQPQPAPMYPPQFVVPGPPPPPPVTVYPQSQPPLFTVIPPPPPPPPAVQAQGFVLPHPPPRIEPVPAVINPQPPKPNNPRPPRAPSPGHASTIEDDESDRGGALSPARRRSQSYRSSTSLDSEMRSGLESLIERAERRKRIREAERLQALVDRYDNEEREAQGSRADARGPVADTSREADPTRRVTPERPRRRGVQLDHREDEADDTDDEQSEPERPRRHVTFHQPSLEVLESRIGHPRGPSPSDDERPTQEDTRHAESRVGRRRRTPSPDERIVERPMGPTPGRAESRIGRPRRPSPTRERYASRRGAHGFPGAGESRVGHRNQRRPQAQTLPETSPQGTGATYESPPAPHGGHPSVDDGLLLNVPHTVGTPSSTGATCGNGSQSSEGSRNDRQRMMNQYRRDRDTRGHFPLPHPQNERRRQWDTLSLVEDSDDDEDDGNSNRKGKRSWISKLASFLPTMARLATNNPVAREVAEGIAEGVTGGEGRRAVEEERPAGEQSTLANDGRRVIPMIDMTLAGGDHGRKGKQTRPRTSPSLTPLLKLTNITKHHRPLNYRSRNRRRPSTIAEERPESLQLALEHAAENLAEEAIGSAMERVRSRTGSSGGRADEGPERGPGEGPDEDVQARRRSRRRRTEF
ncbi:hypothetical protein VMCG_00195 [Cytospora schulzeri]|uniref:Uncharacterized protein n=1 Tax=Cytospora schulzeri TaxID=448051 RepID=A0A423X9A6_9PEZI|nr:hypothetical protein VMCG_00195 [Valsa malicola]